MGETITEGVELTLQEGMCFQATNTEGVVVTLDAPARYGGSGEGMGPMEMVLVALGACTGMDVISILRKKRQEITGYSILVDGDRAPGDPKVFVEIRVRHIIQGNAVSEEAVRRSIELSETKYCPVSAMLKQTVAISSTYEIQPAAPLD